MKAITIDDARELPKLDAHTRAKNLDI